MNKSRGKVADNQVSRTNKYEVKEKKRFIGEYM
jgi:hypothetical protein